MHTNQRHNHHLQQKGNCTKISIRGKIARKLPLNPKNMKQFHILTSLTCLNWQDALETILQTANTSAHLHHLFSVVRPRSKKTLFEEHFSAYVSLRGVGTVVVTLRHGLRSFCQNRRTHTHTDVRHSRLRPTPYSRRTPRALRQFANRAAAECVFWQIVVSCASMIEPRSPFASISFSHRSFFASIPFSH